MGLLPSGIRAFNADRRGGVAGCSGRQALNSGGGCSGCISVLSVKRKSAVQRKRTLESQVRRAASGHKRPRRVTCLGYAGRPIRDTVRYLCPTLIKLVVSIADKINLSASLEVVMRIFSAVFALVAMLISIDGGAQTHPEVPSGSAPRPSQHLTFSPKSQRQTPDPDPSNFFGCEKGQYAGPRSGASVYTKDRFVWAVSREFAAEYCMPKEFIDDELVKPIRAVAYRIIEDLDEQRCTAARGPSSCRGMFAHSLEIYYGHGAFERNSTQRTYSPINVSSHFLIAERYEVRKRRIARGELDSPQTSRVFLYGQFVLSAITDGNSQPLLGAFSLRGFHEFFLDDTDFVSIAVPRGFGDMNDWKSSTDRTLYILVDYPKNISAAPSRSHRSISSYQWSIRVPRRIQSAMINEDKSAQPGAK